MKTKTYRPLGSVGCKTKGFQLYSYPLYGVALADKFSIHPAKVVADPVAVMPNPIFFSIAPGFIFELLKKSQ